MNDLLKKSAIGIAVAIGAVSCWSATALAQDTPPSRQAEPAPGLPDEEKPKDLPKAEKLLEQMLQALGGKEALKEIKSTHVTAKGDLPAMAGGGTMELDMYWHADEKIFVKQTMNSPQMPGVPLESTQGSNNGVAWANDPRMGGYQILTPEQAEQVQKSANLLMIPTLAVDRFNTAETVDRATIAGKDAYKIALSDPKSEDEADKNAPDTAEEPDSEEIVFLFVDTKTSLPVAIRTDEQSPMGPIEVTMTFDKWEEIDGFKFFRQLSLDQGPVNMVMTFPTIEVNSVDPAVFELPAEVKKLAEERKQAENSKSESDENGG